MKFWLLLFVFNLLIPVIMIAAGHMMYKHCPKSINSFMGYRTSRSMKNEETWKFANNCCGLLFKKLGLFMIIPTVLIQIPFMHASSHKVGILSAVIIFIQVIILLIPIIPTERALKKKFGNDGKPD